MTPIYFSDRRYILSGRRLLKSVAEEEPPSCAIVMETQFTRRRHCCRRASFCPTTTAIGRAPRLKLDK